MKSHYHCVYKLTYHLVLVTKYRKKCLSNEMLNRLEEIVKKNCADWEIDLLEFNGEADHIHLLLEMHPNIMPSKFINNLKTVSSRLIRKEFEEELMNFEKYRKEIASKIQIFVEFYKKQNLLVEVDGLGSAQEVLDRIVDVVYVEGFHRLRVQHHVV